jgi:hypothetical protein
LGSPKVSIEVKGGPNTFSKEVGISLLATIPDSYRRHYKHCLAFTQKTEGKTKDWKCVRKGEAGDNSEWNGNTGLMRTKVGFFLRFWFSSFFLLLLLILTIIYCFLTYSAGSLYFLRCFVRRSQRRYPSVWLELALDRLPDIHSSGIGFVPLLFFSPCFPKPFTFGSWVGIVIWWRKVSVPFETQSLHKKIMKEG